MLFHRSNAANFTTGGGSVSQSQFFSAEKLPYSEERDTRIIKSTGSGTNAGKHSAKIVGLRCLYQESCLKQVLLNYFSLREGVFSDRPRYATNFVNVSLLFSA